MAYYQNAPGKKKKTDYARTGSWDEEGTHYSDRNGKRYEDSERPSSARRDGRKTGVSGKYDSSSPRKTGGRNQGKRDFTDRRNASGQETRDSGRRNRENVRNGRPREEIRERNTAGDSYREYEYRPASGEQQAADEMNDRILCGRNPIREALRSGREIEKILVQKGELSGSAREIVQEARDRKIMVQEVDKRRLDEIALHHQGLIAFVAAYAYAEVDEILEEAARRNEDPFIVILDGVTDPHNLGAVIRTAECVGAHGVIIPTHRSVGLTPAAVKASAGAIEHIRVARVVNLNRTIDDLKRHGVWTYAVTMDGKDYEKVDFRGGTALVIGAEGEGISRLTEEKCDLKVSLPMKGELDSLNASVAAGVVMYRVLSCRRKG